MVIKHLNTVASTRNTLLPNDSPVLESKSADVNGVRYSDSEGGTGRAVNGASGAQIQDGGVEYDQSQSRRQRRRLDADPEHLGDEHGQADGRSPSTASGRSRSPAAYTRGGVLAPKVSGTSLAEMYSTARTTGSRDSPPEMQDDESYEEESSSGGEDDLAIAVGQLSLNEDEQLRYHGKASGLHLLGVKEREDGRHEGGIW